MEAAPFRRPITQLWRASSTASTISPSFSRWRGATTIWSNVQRSSAKRHKQHWMHKQRRRPLMPPPDLLTLYGGENLEAFTFSFLYVCPAVCCVLALGIPGPIYFLSPSVLARSHCWTMELMSFREKLRLLCIMCCALPSVRCYTEFLCSSIVKLPCQTLFCLQVLHLLDCSTICEGNLRTALAT